VNQLVKVEIPSLAMAESELISVLSSSVYPGAKIESIKMAIGYCRAQNLDPLQKPVHVVPLWDKNSKSMRDVIMPGIGLYRIQAARTGAHLGTSEPEFGPMMKTKLGDREIEHPEWCRVSVMRLVGGQAARFTAVEYWLENYANSGKKDGTLDVSPNAMWTKRGRGQLAKCAEAQALRKGFPELGSAPTAEEMEGKELDVTPEPKQAVNEFLPQATTGAKAGPPLDVDTETGEVTGTVKPTGGEPVATNGMLKTLRAAITTGGKTEDAFKAHFGFLPDAMPKSKINDALIWARA
jgi:phage recombination protein Bet